MAIHDDSQVGLGNYHFSRHSCAKSGQRSQAQGSISTYEHTAKTELKSAEYMTYRIRHCVSCAYCQTRYLIGFSPYANGAYLQCASVGSIHEYVLYCSCRHFPSPNRSKDRAARACVVSNSAYLRGYGTPDEIWFVNEQQEGTGFASIHS